MPGEARSAKYPASPGWRLAMKSMPRGSGARENTTLKSVSGQTFLASQPTRARLSPWRFTSTSWLGLYTVFSGCSPSIVIFTETSDTGLELNFSVPRVYTYSAIPESLVSSCV